MMTGYSVEQLLQQAMDHGAMGVLSKPIDIDKLLKSVDDVKPSGIVLIAEEDPSFGAQLKQHDGRCGPRCDLVQPRNRSGAATIEFLAIIDIGKPLINSVEVYRRLRRQGHVKPAIILTKPGQAGDDAHRCAA